MSSLNLIVTNVKCDGCVDNIINGLSTIDGMDDVAVDKLSGTIQITGTNLDKSTITNKLSELGYPQKQP